MSRTVVVLSGGQDSATCLALALKQYDEVHALTFDYGQRHRTELDAARKVAGRAGIHHHHVVDAKGFGSVSNSALTDPNIEVTANGGLNNLPSTFTPGRNLVFLTMAASYAISRGIHDLVTGVCQTDYSGYPDCRRNTIDALEKAIALGNDLPAFRIHTPLMWLTKADTVRMAKRLDAMHLIALTVTCYHGQKPGCGECSACVLRAKGFEEAGELDPVNEPEHGYPF